MTCKPVIYCATEGGLYLPWALKPAQFEPPITIWSNGRIDDKIIDRINQRERNNPEYKTTITREKANRRDVRRWRKIAYQNVKDQQAA